MLQADEVSFRYGRGGKRLNALTPGAEAGVRRVSVRVRPGGLVGILGPNGSGKTTLLRLLAGILVPASGRVLVDGRDLAGVPRAEIARRIAVVPQETRLAFDYSVLEVALMGRYPHLGAFALEGPEDLAIAREALAATGTLALEGRAFSTLSGGEKQRVIIASALAQAAGILLLDEPTASLDIGYQLEIAALLARLHQERRIAIAVATHDLNFAASLCQDLVLLSEGRVIRSGSSSEVLTGKAVEELYGVRAEVRYHETARHLTVVPIGKDRQVRLKPDPATEGHTAPTTTTQERVAFATPASTTEEAALAWHRPSVRCPPAAAAMSEVPAVGRRLVRTIAIFGLLAVAACLAAPFIGSTAVRLDRLFDRSLPFRDNVDAQIFFLARLPRVLAGALVGGALATAGVAFQALLRNPLATPFTLGVSAGAALGAMLAITFPTVLTAAGIPGVPVASFVGAIGAVAIVYALASLRRRGLSTDVLLLAGVTLNAFFSALILFVQYIADFSQTFRTVRWLMGDLDVAGYGAVVAALPFIVVGLAAFSWLPRALNLLALGPDAAASRGVDVVGAQRLAFFSASLVTGAAVSLGGPIGFIGIVVPHLVRLLVGADHRIVLPASALFGAAFLVACDVGARTLLSPLELPVGIITAMIGGPFFLWLLVRRG